MNSKLNNHWAAWPLKNWGITALITAILLGFGFYGLEQMSKDEFPPFTIRMGVIVAVMPGATSEEIEAQVARPLERYVFTFKEVDRNKTTTQSMNGMCFMKVFFDAKLTNLAPIWNKVKHGVNAYKSQLPSGVVALVVKDDFGDASALLITLESNERSYRELQEYSDELADRLRRIKSVSNVRQYGEKKEQLSIYVDRERLAAYGIGQSALISALSNEGLTTLSGSVSTASTNIPIHLATTRHTEQEVMDHIIFSDATGRVVRVRDIAEVKREYDTSDSYIESGGKRCVLLSLEMTEGNNIVHYGEEVNKVIDTFRQDYLPADVDVLRITDQPKVVEASVTDFLINLIESMAVIILVMMLLFPIRSAIVAAITIPLSTFISVGIMYILGIPLNIITLASLIVVLGMIVDNSIVVIDGYLEYIGNGMERKEAAIMSVKQYFMPMLLATVCICAIFYPILFTMTGEAGDVIGYFPATITICLMVSLAVAACIIPALNVRLIKKAKQKNPDKRDITDWVQDIYEVALKWTFKHPWLTICSSVVLVVLTSLIFPTLKLRQFPFADRNQFACEVFLPNSAGLEETKAITEALRDSLAKDERVTSVTTFMGCSSPRFHTCYEPQLGGKNFAQLIINTTSIETTFEMLNEYAPRLSNNWPGAYVRFKQMDYLPVPTYEYRFYGNDLDSIQLAADRLMERMRQMPELEWVHTDYDQPSPIVDIALDPVTAPQLGITRTMAELQLALQTGKTQVASIWEGNYEVPVVLRDKQTEQMRISDIENLYVTPMSQPLSSIPLRQVADVKTRWMPTNIIHRNGERCITVTAENKRGVLAATVQNRVKDILENDFTLPAGVRAEIGGEPEKNLETVPEVAWGIGIALVIIFFFLLFNFRRFGLTGLCMAAIALSVPGAMIGLGIADITLGLTSLFGFITLMGIIMRNEILIFEHADQKIAEGMSVHDAAFDAGRRRMVPIFLTTATTAVGVIPMILGKSSFWMPVGITIFAGGIGTLILVVTVLPVVYWKLSKEPLPES
ncbi:MAG: efflux RND transporter permease subunit [Bacteroidaceae bacterium]|nr:efflux RND transporter permease subunit [Bacteroidaceae bacterium]MBQ8455723.1 efflux RND transporter permease subunit [Bacteroidaceae bacterium]MBQ9169738.1 efflux RND transporter permease subunit [Bacteroidaceae bacterium]